MSSSGNDSSRKNEIDTFIFFDLETTDLIRGTQLPMITELSMVAVSRDSLKAKKATKTAMPRILQKLTIPIRPTESINPTASSISGQLSLITIVFNTLL